jgi:OmpA-OmpF porin, OOP family
MAHAQTPSDPSTTGMPSSSARTAYASGSDGYSLIPMTRRGYAGLNLGRPEYNTPCGAGGFACDDPNLDGYLYTGGLFNDWLGVELGYYYGGKAERAGGRTKAQGLNLSLVARVPLGAFNVFAKGGAIYGQTDVSSGAGSDIVGGRERGWGASYGAGLGFDFSPNTGVVLEWARREFRYPGGGDRRELDSTSLGLVMRF